MSYQFTRDDIRFLTSPQAADALAAEVVEASLLSDLKRLRRIAGSHAAAVAETIFLRRRAEERWPQSDDGLASYADWLFTDVALQQASPPPVADHRARRLAELVRARGLVGVHDLTCSIGVELAAFHRAGIPAIGSDIDEIRLAMARHNLAVESAPARLTRADARTVTSHSMVRYADPARRDATGRRITGADTIPSVAELDEADPADRPVLRLPPAIDYDTLGRGGEIEIVSWRGTVREAVSWPDWASGAARRRATILTDGGVREQYLDTDPGSDEVIDSRIGGAVGRYLIDPDPAVVRAHLVQQYAARYGLTRLDPHLAYLIGDSPPPQVRAFRIIEAAPYSEKIARAWVRDHQVSTLEIKQRGTPIIPDQLRKRLKLTGDRAIARTLVIARVGRGPVAFFAVAEQPRDAGPS